MGHTGTDGKPFSPDEIERLQRALVALELSCLGTAPDQLSAEVLLEWHVQLSAGIPRMQPGQWRAVEITFGSNFGVPPDRITADLARLLDVHHQTLTTWDEAAPSELAVLEYATRLHADLIAPPVLGRQRTAFQARSGVAVLVLRPARAALRGPPSVPRGPEPLPAHGQSGPADAGDGGRTARMSFRAAAASTPSTQHADRPPAGMGVACALLRTPRSGPGGRRDQLRGFTRRQSYRRWR